MNPVLAQALQDNQAKAQASVNTTDEFISVPVLNQRGQPTGQYQQVPNPNYQKPTVSPALTDVAPNTATAETPVLASAQQKTQQQVQRPATSVPPVLSNQAIQPQQGVLQRPTAPTAPTYGGNVGAQMFARSQAAAAQGGPAMLAGMAQGYNEGKQAQYNADINTYNAELKQYEDGVARYDAAVKKQKQNQEELASTLQPLQTQLGKLQNARARLEVQGSNITGINPEDWRRFSDRFDNSPEATQREMTRKILKDIGVDYTLLKVAQTKGAISEKEMDLFASPQPSANATEEVWKQWLDGQIRAMESVMSNLVAIQNGQMRPSSIDYSADIDALISGGSPQQSNSQPASSKQSSTTLDLSEYGIPEGAVKQLQ